MRSQREAMRYISPEDLKAMDARNSDSQKALDTKAKERRKAYREEAKFEEVDIEKKHRSFDTRKRTAPQENFSTKDFAFVEQARERKIEEINEKMSTAFRLIPLDEKKALAKEKDWLKTVIQDAAATRPEWPTWEVLKHIVGPAIDKRIIEESFRSESGRKSSEQKYFIHGLEMIAHFIHSTEPQKEELTGRFKERPPIPTIMGLPEEEEDTPEESIAA